MLNILLSIIGIIVTILLVVGVHELGHFLAARFCGVKVLRFSIGFGKTLFRWHDNKGTEFAFSAIPLGGYVKMLDENEGPVANEELHLAYNRQALYKKMIIVAMGPVTNLIFAFFLYWLVFVIGFTIPRPLIGEIKPNSIAAQAGLTSGQEIIGINNKPTLSWLPVIINIFTHTGDQDTINLTVKSDATQQIKTLTLDLAHWQMDELKPDPLDSLGIVPFTPNIPPIIGKTLTQNTKLLPGDKIISIDHHPIHYWYDIATHITENPDKTLEFVIERQHKTITLPIMIHSKRDMFFKPYGFLGITPDFVLPKDFLRTNKYNLVTALQPAWNNLEDFTNLNFIMISKMLSGKVSVKSIGGPITIFESAGTALTEGLTAFMSFLAFLSISIGIVNILPIPGLDGGHLFLQLVEAVIRRPISARVQALLFRLGLIVLFLLISQAIVNDILRL